MLRPGRRQRQLLRWVYLTVQIRRKNHHSDSPCTVQRSLGGIPESLSGGPQDQNHFHNTNKSFVLFSLSLMNTQWSFPEAEERSRYGYPAAFLSSKLKKFISNEVILTNFGFRKYNYFPF
jgi:hypothetical protein